MNPPSNPLNDDTFTRWIDGELPAKEASLLDERASATPELLFSKDCASQLGELLRQHLPSKLEPPSPEFFTMSVMEEVTRDLPVRSSVSTPVVSKFRNWFSFLRTPWFAPLASAAAVAVAFLTWNHFTGGTNTGGPSLTQTYTPDPNVTASAYVSNDAGAFVIDLQNLTPVPDTRDIRAFDVASAEAAAPGEPVVLYASSDRSRAVMVLSRDALDAPRIVAIH